MNPAEWTGRAMRGGAYLLGRHAVVSVLNFAVSVALAWFLAPADFGAFALTLPFVTVFLLVSDLGLSAALIRVTGSKLRGLASLVFRWQFLTGLAGLAILNATAGLWREWYSLPNGTESLLRLYSLVLVLVPARSVSVALLERDLRYKRIAGLEVAESLAAQTLVVLLAWRGAGPYALVAAPLCRALIGAVVAPLLAGWRPGAVPRGWAGELGGLLSFGVPLQANHLVNFARDAVVPLLVGKVAGVEAAGFINWATSVANYPALVLMNVGRLFYPLFVRTSRVGQAFRRAVGGVLQLSVWAVGFMCVPLFGLADPLVRALFSAKWAPAIPLFLFFVPINIFLAFSVPATAYFNGIGRPAVRLKWALAGGCILWVLTAFLVGPFGMYGFAAANVTMNLFELGLVVAMMNSIGGTTLPWRAVASTVACALLLFAVARLTGLSGLPGVLAAGLAGIGAFVLAAGRPWKSRE